MSHFVVMVIGDDVDKELAPFHEFECTEINDEFIQDIDKTDDLLDDYENCSNKYYVNTLNGKRYSSNDDIFYREPTKDEAEEIGLSFRPRVKHIPENFVEIEKKYNEVMSFKEFCEYWEDIKFISEGETPDTDDTHKYSYGVVDKNGEVIKVIRRTNPNSKWDWYQIGGRWSGQLKLKPIQLIQGSVGGFSINEINTLKKLRKKNPGKYRAVVSQYKGKEQAIRELIEQDNHIYPEHARGEKSWTNKDEKNEEGFCDQTLKQFIDIEGMEKPMREKAEKRWDEWHEKIKHLGEDHTTRIDWIQYHFGFFWTKEDIVKIKTMSREEYVTCQSIWSPYALVWEGKWYARGEMLFFGVSVDEEDNWNGQFKEFWKQIPDDAQITMVDCHI